MPASTWVHLAARTVLALAVPAFGQTGGNTVRIHLYNLSDTPREVLDAGCTRTARILASAGVRIVWLAGSADSPEAHTVDMVASTDGRNLDSRDYLVVRLVRGLPSTMLPGALGFALPQARFGAHVTIFYDRVQRLMPRQSADSAVLGAVLAHEIGHVMLNSPDHSPVGLMKAAWGGREFGLAGDDRLEFTSDESARVLDAARRRSAACAIPDRIAANPSGREGMLPSGVFMAGGVSQR